MIPFGNEKVTLVKRTEATGQDGKTHAVYTNITLTGCSWRRTTQMSGTNEQSKSERITCKVPADQTAPRAGDLMVRGDFTGTVTRDSDYRDIIRERSAEGGAFEVTAVSDNFGSEIPLPHTKATGWI